jgi:hypothetical protein
MTETVPKPKLFKSNTPTSQALLAIKPCILDFENYMKVLAKDGESTLDVMRVAHLGMKFSIHNSAFL